MTTPDKIYMGNIDHEQERCLRCGSPFLDTGWECTDCGYDNRPHYYVEKMASDDEP